MTGEADFSDVIVVLVAAGRGTRAGEGLPKQYRKLAGKTILTHVLDRFGTALPGATIIPVIHTDDQGLFGDAIGACSAKSMVRPAVYGGATRQESVLNGLKAIAKDLYKIVLIHDCARVFSTNTLIYRGVDAARMRGAAVPVIPVADSLRRTKPDGSSAPVSREGLLAAQTPQCFRLDLIRDAHERAAAAGLQDFSDDASVAEWAGYPVHTFPGDAGNFKLTVPEDFVRAETLLMADLADVRVGYGYDVHAFGRGDHCWIGGVKIPHSRALEGHSDADVGLHALTDAILGALADGDIGKLFPPSDPQWRGAASYIFLEEAVRRVQRRGGMIAHLDLTLVCEEPKIGPHRDAMRAEIARICGMPFHRVAVKATTSEQLGFTGRREGIAANAIATVRLPLTGEA
jgi:2-C-methyl-D-erythritol 4-phosphate cytidylyltransferase/2-C-methyl-D-erythritol 2,4-cyclodiphosphate synthase